MFGNKRNRYLYYCRLAQKFERICITGSNEEIDLWVLSDALSDPEFVNSPEGKRTIKILKDTLANFATSSEYWNTLPPDIREDFLQIIENIQTLRLDQDDLISILNHARKHGMDSLVTDNARTVLGLNEPEAELSFEKRLRGILIDLSEARFNEAMNFVQIYLTKSPEARELFEEFCDLEVSPSKGPRHRARQRTIVERIVKGVNDSHHKALEVLGWFKDKNRSSTMNVGPFLESSPGKYKFSGAPSGEVDISLWINGRVYLRDTTISKEASFEGNQFMRHYIESVARALDASDPRPGGSSYLSIARSKLSDGWLALREIMKDHPLVRKEVKASRFRFCPNIVTRAELKIYNRVISRLPITLDYSISLSVSRNNPHQESSLVVATLYANRFGASNNAVRYFFDEIIGGININNGNMGVKSGEQIWRIQRGIAEYLSKGELPFEENIGRGNSPKASNVYSRSNFFMAMAYVIDSYLSPSSSLTPPSGANYQQIVSMVETFQDAARKMSNSDLLESSYIALSSALKGVISETRASGSVVMRDILSKQQDAERMFARSELFADLYLNECDGIDISHDLSQLSLEDREAYISYKERRNRARARKFSDAERPPPRQL